MKPIPSVASLALLQDGKCLVIRRAYAPYQGLWSLPGGRIEPGETAAQCAVREVAEEVGLLVQNPVAVTHMKVAGRSRQVILEVFASQNFAGKITPSDEVLAWGWYDPEEIKALATTPDLEKIIAKARALLTSD